MYRVRLFVIILSLSLNAHAQESLLKQIDKVLTKEDSTQSKMKLMSAKNSLDTVFNANQFLVDTCTMPMEEVLSSELDTQAFQQRQVTLKKGVVDNGKTKPVFVSQHNYVHLNPYKKYHLLDSTYNVFGWHPHWSKDAYKSYNFSLLSMISYFSYEVDPKTGFYETIHDWKETALVDSAKQHNCKVLLTLSSFGKRDNHKLLNNKTALQNLISTSITLVRERDADGLTIDFEGIRSGDKDLITNFIIAISSQLKSENSDYILSLALPAVDYTNVFAITELDDYVDFYVMMGYEFHGENSKVAGPVAPLANGTKWTSFNLQKSVEDYLGKGLPVNKFILGLPYYGAEWETKDLKFPSVAKQFVKYHSYRQVKNITGKSSGGLDESSSSKFFTYSTVNSQYRQIWFEDTVSLGKKYDYIKETGLAGVGIWALGFDHGHDELWKLLANKFAYSDQVVEEIAKSKTRFSWRRIMGLTMRIMRNPQSILKRPRPFLSLFGSLAGVSLVGFFIMLRYGHRFKRFIKLILQGGLAAMFIVAVGLLFVFFNYLGIRETLYMLGGFLIGLLLFLFFSRKYLVDRDLP